MSAPAVGAVMSAPVAGCAMSAPAFMPASSWLLLPPQPVIAAANAKAPHCRIVLLRITRASVDGPAHISSRAGFFGQNALFADE
jgi:hypothetical protein